MAGANERIQGLNLFAYCFNNPANLSDEDGNWPSWAKKLVTAVAIAAAVAVVAAAKCNIPNFEWRGSGTPESGRGNFVNMKTGEWLHSNLNHGPPIGPHWDYGVRGSPQTFRIFPDSNILPK
ncbi:hypothetical protein IAG03_06245 [Clostridiales bacterium NSJ-40]|uniref:RHS repeat-associated core domain-containing protein n=1 Tax=Yeguia hominis TaxID=2763662 RepID=A0A926HMX7_9FIRM|nr:hypothetical protein [Yeguia hominis]